MILALMLATAPVVATDSGPVRGEAIAHGGGVFRGIRYAAPPVGALRWRAPQPPRRWAQPADATRDYAACPQREAGEWNRVAAASGAEDCLFLDVRTPTLTPGAKLPVMVWIHGGSNRAGSGAGTVSSRITDRGIVLVAIQYRLGALGFLSHAALSAEQGGASGNYGLMDQQAALRWVRANIARFGGDPARVTIAGESAGAQDVGLHLLAPASRGLFAQALAESGTPGFGVAPRSLAQNEALGARIAGAARTTTALRALPVSAILAAQEPEAIPGLEDKSFIWLQATVDGRVLRETPAAAIRAGRFARVPMLLGVNAKEFTGYAGRDPTPVIAREFRANAAAVRAAYARAEPRLGDAAMQLGTDLVFRCPTIVLSKALAARGAPVWQYQFDYARAGQSVSHASELPFVFGAPDAGEPALPAYWAAFVKTGDPNADGLPRWPRYTVAERGYLAFDQGGTVARRDLRGAVCVGREMP